MSLIGFAGDIVISKSIVTLPVTTGTVPHRLIHMDDLIIVDSLGAYNIILDKPSLTKTKATVSLHLLAIKIPTATDVVTIKRDDNSIK